MKFTVLTAALGLTLTVSSAFASMPKSQIWLAKESDKGLKVVPITDSKVYSNQPLVTKQGVYFTREVKEGEKSQTDLFLFSFDDRQSRNLTNTEVSEYSPTLYPYDSGLSAIVVEPTGQQKLWFYPFDKAQSAHRIFEHIEPVGYHAWGNSEHLIMFILGMEEDAPHTLQYTDLAGHLPKVIAENIGRTLAYNAALGVYSFSYQYQNQSWFSTFDPNSQQVKRHFALPDRVQDYTWLDVNHIAYAIGNNIYKRNMTTPKQVTQWYNLSGYCNTQITRMSYYNKQLAFVCQH